jgi:helicase HerA-like protein
VSQNPLDIPDVVLGQLGNRVQHALRAFTPRDQKAVKAAAETFRQNPNLKVEAVLTQLAVGEALVSMLDENGSPQIVERAKIVPPRSQVGAITPDQRKQIINSSVLAGHYEEAIDRESAYEILQARAGEKVQTTEAPPVAAGAPAGEQTKPSMQVPFNQQLGRVAPFATHLRRQWQRARCARRAASSGASLFAEFWGESSMAAAAAADRCLEPRICGPYRHVAQRRGYGKNRQALSARRSCLPLIISSSAPQRDWHLLSFHPCRPSLPLLWPTWCR